jgi:maltooligosyltrehalose trehalohydrolase
VPAGQQKIAAVLTLCSPFLPLLFMGEEYGETAPFLYFTSFDDPDLAAAVREGRKKELGTHYSKGDFSDPQALATFERCKLDWLKTAISSHAEILRLYRELISLRKQYPSLGNGRKDLSEIQFDEQAKWLVMKRSDPAGSSALLVCNFSSGAQSVPVAAHTQPRRLVLWTGDAVYGGSGAPGPVETLAPGSPFGLSLAGFEGAIFVC